jgi:Arc/MetJ-type ribon-helix-helix transcriptional regulator
MPRKNAGDKMRMTTLFLPDKEIEGLDSLVREKKYGSRSEAIRTAIRDFLKKKGVWTRHARP